MRRLLFIVVVMLTALTPCVSAQRFSGGAAHFSSGFPHFGGHSRFAYPLGFADPFYADYLSGVGYPAAYPPPVIVVQSQAAPAGDPNAAHPTPPAQPLTIELRGDRYVRINSDDTSGAETIDVASPPAVRGSGAPDFSARPATAHETQPVVLVFRDGHREEVSEYTIAGGMLYTRGDFYANGSWTRSIDLATLNLSETLDSNQSRGVPFQLPSAPNEIIVRP